MVDAIGLRFVEDAADRIVDLVGAGQVAADRLLQHHARLAAVEVVFAQAVADVDEQFRRGREIEHPHVIGLFADQRGERIPAFVLARVERAVGDLREEGVDLVLGTAGLEQRLADVGAVAVIVQPLAGNADDAAAGRDLAVEEAMEQGGQQLAQGKVARAAENHQVECVDQGSRSRHFDHLGVWRGREPGGFPARSEHPNVPVKYQTTPLGAGRAPRGFRTGLAGNW